ncbi:cache domain-containing sensor histidine kinase [Paenibacillus sedimenti]|uniref:histidine kinase n=1 Tax=Paenibacillus sedimenti TaxID=2770274 RepID=A0A926QMA5_9BACL|nr:sensor histidine kinase [Paenibacillus sedimenti]MBD0383184.1 sensor histidine kinase [Paenibacillus sedimenti]
MRVKSIQFTITLSFIFITVTVMLIVSLVLYNKFSRTAEENAFLNTQQIIEQMQFNLENYIEGMADTFQVVDAKIAKSRGIPSDKLLEQLDTIASTREDIVSIDLFTADGELVTGIHNTEMRKNTRLTEQSWFKSALENPNHLTFSLPHIQNLFKEPYKWVVSMSKGVTIQREGQWVDAVLLVDVNFKTLDDVFRTVSLGKKGYVYIIDESAGNIVYHPQQQLIYIGLKYENVEQALKFSYGKYMDEADGETRLNVVKTVSNIGWKIIGVSYLDEIVTTRNEISTFMIWLFVIVLVFILLISAFMSARISQPIKRLKKSMEMVEKGHFDTYIHVRGADEVEQLSRRFNLMVSRVRELMDQSIHEQEVKRKNELEVLQSQINPHFLYNTLNSVVRMVGSGKNEEVVTTITSLSKFFRISLSKGKNIITVQEEIEHIRNYLIIQKMRYKDKFDYEIQVDEEALPYKTLKLILQPIVENALYHGIEYMVDEGHIRISARIEGERILFQIRDNGVGIPEETLKGILSGQTKSEKGSGVGLRNVNERIKLYFGPSYGVTVESEPEEGTMVNIWIPKVLEEEV